MKHVCVGLLLCAALSTTSTASAQVSITGAIAGTVTDSTDSVLPGATVLLRDEGTDVKKQTVTNESGAFAFRDLNFGTYEVTVSLNGFQTALYKKVSVEAGRTTDLRVRLAVGALEQNITVEGTTPVLEMTSAEMASFLRDHPAASSFATSVRDLAGAADRVKFARGAGLEAEARRHLESARALVRGIEDKLRPKEQVA